MLLLGKPCEDDHAQVARAAVEATRCTVEGTGFRFPSSRRNAVSAPGTSLPGTKSKCLKPEEAVVKRPAEPMLPAALEELEAYPGSSDMEEPGYLDAPSESTAPTLMRAAAAQAVHSSAVPPQPAPLTSKAVDIIESTPKPYPAASMRTLAFAISTCHLRAG